MTENEAIRVHAVQNLAIQGYKNRLASRIQIYTESLTANTGRLMTVELGMVMRSDLRHVLRELKREGVPLSM